jgi:hypothetical protein
MAYFNRVALDDHLLDGLRDGVLYQVLRWDRHAGHRAAVRFWQPRLFDGDLFLPGPDIADGWTNGAGTINLVVRSGATADHLEAVAQHELGHSLELAMARCGVTVLPTPAFGSVKTLAEVSLPGGGTCSRFAQAVGDAHPLLIDIGYLTELRALTTPAPPAVKAGGPSASRACTDADCGCHDLHDGAVRSWYHAQLAKTGRYHVRACPTMPPPSGVCAVAARKGWAFSVARG